MSRKPSYVYIMRLTWGRIKIGYSNRPELRKSQVNEDVRVKRVLATWRCKNSEKAYKLEQWLHRRFWFLRWWGRYERFYMPLFTWWLVVPCVLFWKALIGWWR